MIKFIDLFAGIGGIRLGLENALDEFGIDHRCVLSSEINRAACDTYKLNFNEDPYLNVKKIDENQIPDFDFLLAGFPCQPFSYAGKKSGFADTRGTLFFDIERILKKKEPKYVLLENVRGLFSHDGGRTLQTIKRSLETIGYSVEIRILNSSDYGIPQNRVRLFIVGCLGVSTKLNLVSSFGVKDTHSYNAASEQLKLFSKSNLITVSDILEKNPPVNFDCSNSFNRMVKSAVDGDLNKIHGYRLIDYRGGKSLHSWDLGLKGTCNKDEREFMNLLIQNRRQKKFGVDQDGKKLTKEQILTFYPHSSDKFENITTSLLNKGYLKNWDGRYDPVCGNMSFEVFKFLDPNRISVTLTSSDTGRLGVFYNNRLRRITTREAARLQGFPDTFKLNDNINECYKQFGNSVSVPVISEVVKDIIKNN